MITHPMRRIPAPSLSSLRWKSFVSANRLPIQSAAAATSALQVPPSRHLAQVRSEPFSELWFTPSSPRRNPADDLISTPSNGSDHKPPDERTLKLGKTLRTLSPLLPNILTSPLPQEIISPQISLHLFPSTHPHLPAVKGKVPYRAALWTAPVAWGCVPIVGNVQLRILSEKIVRTGFVAVPNVDEAGGEEKLVVRWKTEPRTNGNGVAPTAATSSANSTSTAAPNGNGLGINRTLSSLLGGDKPIFNLSADSSFTGLFIFSFDADGRIVTHTIEHADESNGFDKTSRVVTLTDWLLGKAKWGRGREAELIPGLAMRVCKDEWARGPVPGSGE